MAYPTNTLGLTSTTFTLHFCIISPQCCFYSGNTRLSGPNNPLKKLQIANSRPRLSAYMMPRNSRQQALTSFDDLPFKTSDAVTSL